ncbi:MAG: hypothetical protein ABI683_11650 [Ginsengibacter sp.]
MPNALKFEIEIGWSISKFEEFTVDDRWIYIPGLAFGSKAFQRFGEQEEEPSEKAKNTTMVRVNKEITPINRK